jgi:DNA-binding response OmpR family regulator
MEQQRVLLVDDDPGLTTLLELVFRRAGFEVHSANNGFDGINQAGLLSPNLMVLDIMMPDISGIEVCRQIRANPKTAELPVMILSASGNKEDREMALEAGADTFIQKPISPTELVGRVKELLLARVPS